MQNSACMHARTLRLLRAMRERTQVAQVSRSSKQSIYLSISVQVMPIAAEQVISFTSLVAAHFECQDSKAQRAMPSEPHVR